VNGKAGGSTGKPRLSPKCRPQLKLQGQYIGYITQLSQKDKMAVKSILEKKGIRAAVAWARQLMERKAA
jgi:hypothetical protein